MWHKSSITKLAFKLHGLLGLTAGFFFLLFGLSGSMLMFRSDLDRHFNPELHALKTAPTTVSADHIYRMIAATHPDLNKIVLHDFPADEHDCYEFMVYKNQQMLTENYLYYIAVNPYNGRILREGNYADFSPSFFRWLYSFHYSLQLGVPGKAFTAFIGLIMLLSLLTGSVVYRKHFWATLRFRNLNFKNKRTVMSSLHRTFGVWSIPFLVILFFTGFWMNRQSFQSAAWQLTPAHQNILVKANIDTLTARSKKIVPGFLPVAVNIPCVAGQDVLIRGKMPGTSFFLWQGKASSLSFDAATGQFKKLENIEQQSFNKRFDAAVYQLHIGAYGNNLLRWFYVIIGLLPGVLTITGSFLWLKRKKY